MKKNEQLERIREMEECLDLVQPALQALSQALSAYLAAQPALARLDAYYGSALWRQDYEDDEAGRLPSALKRGVLSEDALYELFCEERALRAELRQFLAAGE